MARTAKTTKNKTIPWHRLYGESLKHENQRVLRQTRDRIRKYNEKYGTNYVLPSKGIDLYDPNLHIKLEAITTKSIKAGVTDVLGKRYTVNAVELSKDEWQEMRNLERKANRLKGPRQDGSPYYKPYFESKAGYNRYIKTLRERSTMQGYLEGIKHGLQVFKTNLIYHVEDLMSRTTLSEEDKEDLNQIYEFCNTSLNTYSRLDKLYKFVKSKGYTGDMMAKIFFDSNLPTMLEGEDVKFIQIMKEAMKHFGWAGPGRLTQLEKAYPIDIL